MAVDIVHLNGLQRPFRVALSIGGAIPYDWDLYDYVPQGGTWMSRFLGRGTGTAPLELDQELVGHSLLWSVATHNLDTSARDVDVVASISGGAGQPVSLKKSWTADPSKPRFFFTIEVAS